jgi:hypothetical protein
VTPLFILSAYPESSPLASMEKIGDERAARSVGGSRGIDRLLLISDHRARRRGDDHVNLLHLGEGRRAHEGIVVVSEQRSTPEQERERGQSEQSHRLRDFAGARVEKAQAECESRDVALIAKAAGTDWRAATWRLERRAPRRYGPLLS